MTEVDGFVGVFEDNVGDAEIKGIELESLINPADGLYIELSHMAIQTLNILKSQLLPVWLPTLV